MNYIFIRFESESSQSVKNLGKSAFLPLSVYFCANISVTVCQSTDITDGPRRDPRRRPKLASRRRNVQMFSFVGFPYFMQRKYFFCFDFELLGAKPYLFALYQWRAEKRVGLWRTHARNKMAALTVVFSRLPSVSFVTNWTMSVCAVQYLKNRCEYIFLPISIDINSVVSSPGVH